MFFAPDLKPIFSSFCTYEKLSLCFLRHVTGFVQMGHNCSLRLVSRCPPLGVSLAFTVKLHYACRTREPSLRYQSVAAGRRTSGAPENHVCA